MISVAFPEVLMEIVGGSVCPKLFRGSKKCTLRERANNMAIFLFLIRAQCCLELIKVRGNMMDSKMDYP